MNPFHARRRWPRAAIALLSAALTAVGSLAGLEVYCRRHGLPFDSTPPSPPHLAFLLEKSRRLFAIEDGRFFRITDPRLNYPLARSPETRRLAVVGESTAGILAPFLTDLAARSPLAGRLEVVDASVSGGNLRDVARAFDETIGYSPDAILLVFGHNLTFHHDPMRPVPEPLFRLSERSRLAALLTFRFWSVHEPSVGREARLIQWETFLRRAAATARERGFRLFVCTMQGNDWFPPAAGEAERNHPAFLNAVYLRATSRAAEARRALARALLEPYPPALWHFTLGQWLYEDGRHAEAAAAFARAAEERGGGRMIAAVNEVVRRTAREAGFEVVDLAAFLRRGVPHGIPGWETFHDNCHPLDPGGGAAFCLERLQAAGWLEPNIRWPVPPPVNAIPLLYARVRSLVENAGTFPDNWRDSLTFWIASLLVRGSPVSAEELVAAADAAWAPGLVPPGAARAAVMLACADGFARRRLWGTAYALNDRAAAEDPRSSRPWLQRGLYELQNGRRTNARDLFRRALELSDDPAARFFLDRLGEGPRPDRPNVLRKQNVKS